MMDDFDSVMDKAMHAGSRAEPATEKSLMTRIQNAAKIGENPDQQVTDVEDDGPPEPPMDTDTEVSKHADSNSQIEAIHQDMIRQYRAWAPYDEENRGTFDARQAFRIGMELMATSIKTAKYLEQQTKELKEQREELRKAEIANAQVVLDIQAMLDPKKKTSPVQIIRQLSAMQFKANSDELDKVFKEMLVEIKKAGLEVIAEIGKQNKIFNDSAAAVSGAAVEVVTATADVKKDLDANKRMKDEEKAKAKRGYWSRLFSAIMGN